MSHAPARRAALALALLTAAVPSRPEGPYEALPVVDAGSLSLEQPLEAPEYRVDPWARCDDGFLYRFEVVTPSGSFAARGLAELPIRLREAHALSVLAERSAGEVAAESAGDAVEGAVGSVVQVVEEPGDTAKGAARGIGRWARRTALAARELATDVKERVDEARAGEDAGEPSGGAAQETAAQGGGAGDAAGDAPGDGTGGAAEGGAGGAPDEQTPNAAGETAKAVGRFVLGHSSARRQYAAKLGVDPYTRNPVLSAELDRVAWSASAARFGTRMLIPDLPLAQELQDVYGLVWAHHPRDLEVRHRGLADEWGVDRETRDRFFWNDAWTTTEQTALVAAIASLGGTPGKRTLIEDSASLTEPDAIARRVADVRLLAALYEAGTRFVRVEAEGGYVWATTRREVIVPFAVDHLVWTAELEASLRERAAAIDRRAFEERPRVLAVAGAVSERARSAARAEGWRVRPVERGTATSSHPAPASK